MSNCECMHMFFGHFAFNSSELQIGTQEVWEVRGMIQHQLGQCSYVCYDRSATRVHLYVSVLHYSSCTGENLKHIVCFASIVSLLISTTQLAEWGEVSYVFYTCELSSHLQYIRAVNTKLVFSRPGIEKVNLRSSSEWIKYDRVRKKTSDKSWRPVTEASALVLNDISASS